MAEVAAFSLATSILQLIDFSAKVVSRLNDFNSRINDVPQTFRTLAVQLALLHNILQRIKKQADDGLVDHDCEQLLKPTIDESTKHAKYLDSVLSRLTPTRTDSTLERSLSALKSLAKDSRVKKETKELRHCIQILGAHQSTTGVDISNNILKLLESLNLSSSTAEAELAPGLLHQAVKDKKIETLCELVEFGADIDERNESGDTPLHTALWFNREEVTKYLCENGANINAKDREGQTPLHKAVSLELKGMVDILCEEGANVNAKDKEGRTPLHVALIARNLLLAEQLRQSGGRYDLTDKYGKTPLDYAEDTFISRWQKKHGTKLEDKDPQTGNTALIQAASQGELEAVERLLDLGACVDATNKWERTALAEACIRNYEQVVRKLIEYGADPNAVDEAGWSPFTRSMSLMNRASMCALLKSGRVKLEARNTPRKNTPLEETVLNDQWWSAFCLLENGADPKIRSYSGNALLQLAVRSCSDEYVIKKFLECGADFNATNEKGDSALTEAVERQRWTVMEMFLKRGANPNGKSGAYPFLCRLVMARVDRKWISLLVETYGANIDAPNNDGWTALREAVTRGFADKAGDLLSLGADPNNKIASAFKQFDRRCDVTILMCAIYTAQNWREVILTLLRRGARLEDKDDHGWTALRIAAEKGRDDMACVLLVKGADAHAKAKDGKTPIEVARLKNLQEFCSLVDIQEAAV